MRCCDRGRGDRDHEQRHLFGIIALVIRRALVAVFLTVATVQVAYVVALVMNGGPNGESANIGGGPHHVLDPAGLDDQCVLPAATKPEVGTPDARRSYAGHRLGHRPEGPLEDGPRRSSGLPPNHDARALTSNAVCLSAPLAGRSRTV